MYNAQRCCFSSVKIQQLPGTDSLFLLPQYQRYAHLYGQWFFWLLISMKQFQFAKMLRWLSTANLGRLQRRIFATRHC